MQFIYENSWKDILYQISFLVTPLPCNARRLEEVHVSKSSVHERKARKSIYGLQQYVGKVR